MGLLNHTGGGLAGAPRGLLPYLPDPNDTLGGNAPYGPNWPGAVDASLWPASAGEAASDAKAVGPTSPASRAWRIGSTFPMAPS